MQSTKEEGNHLRPQGTLEEPCNMNPIVSLWVMDALLRFVSRGIRQQQPKKHSLNNVHVLITRTCGCVTLHGNEELKLQMKLFADQLALR